MQYDLELVLVKNSHEFVDEYLKRPEFVELMRRLGALGDGNKDPSKSDMLFVSRSFSFSYSLFQCLEILGLYNSTFMLLRIVSTSETNDQ